jgi:hypothetical protein
MVFCSLILSGVRRKDFKNIDFGPEAKQHMGQYVLPFLRLTANSPNRQTNFYKDNPI